MAKDSPLSLLFTWSSIVLAIGAVGWGTFGEPVAPLTATQQRAFSVFLFAIILWLAEPVPYAITSVVAVGLLLALDVVDSFDAAVTGFSSTLVFFLLLLLLLGRVSRRFASTSGRRRGSSRRG